MDAFCDPRVSHGGDRHGDGSLRSYFVFVFMIENESRVDCHLHVYAFKAL